MITVSCQSHPALLLNTPLRSYDFLLGMKPHCLDHTMGMFDIMGEGIHRYFSLFDAFSSRVSPRLVFFILVLGKQ